MKEVNNIGPISQAQAAAKAKQTKAVQGESFENTLQETVAKIESMGSEIDALIEGKETKNTTAMREDVDQLGNMIQSMKGLVENISPPTKPQTGSAKFVASQYEKMNRGKDS